MMEASEVRFGRHADENGLLCVYESGQHVPFDIKRVFTVSAGLGDIRGNHAHKACSQLLVCISGKIRVTCDNGSEVREHLLDDMGTGLLVPPGIWAKEEYLEAGAVLMVFCDRGYEADDYIRNYNEFRKFLGEKEST